MSSKLLVFRIKKINKYMLFYFLLENLFPIEGSEFEE